MAGVELRTGYWRNVAIAAVVAAVAVVVIHLIASALDVSMIADTPGGTQEVGMPIATIQAILFTFVGAGFGWLVARYSSAAAMAWLVAAIVVLLAFGFNAFLAAEDTATGVVLNIEHLAVFTTSLVWVYPALQGR